ncbi:pyridine nucleotide-disulfide oxidoreductase [Janibacter sp. Soil728]|uniref:NAD(P)-binding protein n=1 Tax=Janibacter sp. Soil728 TaxID=1736393 RepID=UPI0006FD71AF|nr:NAD(P)-binding protein [Janibacter sp. Soil728]KRE38253.1 pyridine nucleotide-disulfide oxidoreductase [Janibacter sp. Soil728]
MGTIEADYVVVGAGAMGMAFTDALISHADVRVALLDRRHAPGGHWLDAYPFVRLHQASAFYGVASTLLGDGRAQQHGPERGLHERATAAQICAYYDSVLTERLVASGRVSFMPGYVWTDDGRCVSTISGERHNVRGPARVVNAHYLSPHIPATTMPPFAVDTGARVIPVNELVRVADAPSEYVVVGSGKTATDACIWLLDRGVDPDRICWVRSREPWMLNRAMIQPDPRIFLGAAADVMEVAATAATADEIFLGLEERGVLLRIDPTVTPTMAKTPTLATWELDVLRTIEHVVRLGHVLAVEQGRVVCADGSVQVAPDALVVHCAASGLRYPPLVPIWQPEVITLQPIRTGFPCFGAALAGHAEATISSDVEKNRLCPPSPYSDTPTDWLAMQVIGARAGAAFASDPHLKAWADTVALNPARTPPELAESEAMQQVLGRLRASAGPALTRMAELAGMP